MAKSESSAAAHSQEENYGMKGIGMGMSAFEWPESLAADFIMEWMDGHPSRNLASLSRQTGIPKSEISMIMNGKMPSLCNSIKLGTVLPADKIMELLCHVDPEFQSVFFRFLSS